MWAASPRRGRRGAGCGQRWRPWSWWLPPKGAIEGALCHPKVPSRGKGAIEGKVPSRGKGAIEGKVPSRGSSMYRRPLRAGRASTITCLPRRPSLAQADTPGSFGIKNDRTGGGWSRFRGAGGQVVVHRAGFEDLGYDEHGRADQAGAAAQPCSDELERLGGGRQ
jgi:hypothetical protein